MNVSAISNNSQTWQAMMQQRKQDISQLGSALQGGDLSTAQKAFSDLQSLASNSQSVSSTSSTSDGNGNTASSDFSALGQALQSGNVSDAQNAFAKLQTDMQAHKGGHHHHHHSGSSDASGQQNGVSSDFSALGQALQSGNLNDAQSAFAKLQNDLQTSRLAAYTNQGSIVSANTGTTSSSGSTAVSLTV